MYFSVCRKQNFSAKCSLETFPLFLHHVCPLLPTIPLCNLIATAGWGCLISPLMAEWSMLLLHSVNKFPIFLVCTSCLCSQKEIGFLGCGSTNWQTQEKKDLFASVAWSTGDHIFGSLLVQWPRTPVISLIFTSSDARHKHPNVAFAVAWQMIWRTLKIAVLQQKSSR